MRAGLPTFERGAARLAAIVVGLAVSVGAGTGGAGDGSPQALTLTEVEAIACHCHPDLAAAAARVDAQRGRQLQSGLYPNPVLAYDVGNIGADRTAGEHGFYLEQQFLTGGKRHWRQADTGWGVVVRQWEVEAERQRILAGVRRRYHDVLALQQRAEHDEHVAALFEELHQKTRQLQDTEEANEADVLLARESARRRSLEVGQSRSRHLAGWQEMVAYVGRPDLPPARLEATRAPSRGEQPDPDALLSQAMANSARILAARAEVQRAHAGLFRQRAEAVPNVTVRAGAYYDFAGEETVGSLRVSLPLPLWDRNQGAIFRAEAEIREACAELERLQIELQRRLALLVDRYRRNAAVVEEYTRFVLPEARQAYDIYRRRFAEEKSSYSSVSSALENYAERLSEYLEGLRDLRRTELDLDDVRFGTDDR